MMESGLQGYRIECISTLNSVNLDAVEQVTRALLQAHGRGSGDLIVGNGGSAATASHMATDLMLASGLANSPLRVIALADSHAVITATGNDFGWDQFFSRQIPHLTKPRDLLIAVLASGNSPNVLSCVRDAIELGLTTLAFTGFGGGKLATMMDVLVHVPTRHGAYCPVGDVHSW